MTSTPSLALASCTRELYDARLDHFEPGMRAAELAYAAQVVSIAEKKKSWHPSTGMRPNATIRRQCRRRNPRWRPIAARM